VKRDGGGCASARGIGILIVVGTVFVTLTIIDRADSGHAVLPLDIIVGVLACTLLPLLLRWPISAAVALAILAAFSPAATPPSTIGTLHVARERPVASAVGVGLVGLAAHAVQGLLRPAPGLSYEWWLVLALVTHAGSWRGVLSPVRGARSSSRCGSEPTGPRTSRPSASPPRVHTNAP
jgi:hypothetical protein